MHIYRLVASDTVEENILVKAQQKRHLDFLVAGGGTFGKSLQQKQQEEAAAKAEAAQSSSDPEQIFTKSGLQNLLGRPSDGSGASGAEGAEGGEGGEGAEGGGDGGSSGDSAGGEGGLKEAEAAMASFEDDDDRKAMIGARKEAAAEASEFDDEAPAAAAAAAVNEAGSPRNAAGSPTNESGGSKGEEKTDEQREAEEAESNKAAEKEQEKKLEEEFAAWQSKIGPDFDSLRASLKPIERYALTFRTDTEPFFSLYFLTDQTQREGAVEQEEVDVDAIEAEKAEEEARCFDDGELLHTGIDLHRVPRHKHLYDRERGRTIMQRKRRRLTGEDWQQRQDQQTGLFYWLNIDTGPLGSPRHLLVYRCHAHHQPPPVLNYLTPSHPISPHTQLLAPTPPPNSPPPTRRGVHVGPARGARAARGGALGPHLRLQAHAPLHPRQDHVVRLGLARPSQRVARVQDVVGGGEG